MNPIVLIGHRHDCPLHGATTVTTAAAHLLIEGSPAARVGDTTSHGGTLVEGDASWLVA
ncbi:hypothetical protein F3J45_22920 [Pantoea sp. Ap-967]|uniref:PAAR domain-containing protein n=1 Tax=Pantoea sp. Ap-967 TaxID=2608362 RepID=UPI00141F4978|nr:PAAR domain-containing protein [Pantoea sp. Ap-967]NIE77292.1 hypothetical protein [Pantoea sp. Ap-967]